MFRISRPTAHNRVIEVVTATIYRLLRMQDLDFLPTNPTVHFLYLLTIYPTSDDSMLYPVLGFLLMSCWIPVLHPSPPQSGPSQSSHGRPTTCDRDSAPKGTATPHGAWRMAITPVMACTCDFETWYRVARCGNFHVNPN